MRSRKYWQGNRTFDCPAYHVEPFSNAEVLRSHNSHKNSPRKPLFFIFLLETGSRLDTLVMPVLMMKNVLWFTCVLLLNNYSIICTAQSETSRRSFQYTILPDTGKWHLLLWQHLAVIENTSTVECGIACLHVGNDCKAFATRNYNQCLLLGSFRPTSGTLWMNSNGEWTIFRKENGRFLGYKWLLRRLPALLNRIFLFTKD